jgi:hypothetical protein
MAPASMDKPTKISQAITYKPQNTKLFVFDITTKFKITLQMSIKIY